VSKSASKSGSAPGSGSLEKDVEWYALHVGAPLLAVLFVLAGIGALIHKTAPQMWESVKSGQAASSAWRAVQGTRCDVGTCPKNQWIKALDALTVAPEANATTYRRDKFGVPWTDVDGNHCDTRDDILRRDLDQLATRKTGSCSIGAAVAGTFTDPYSGATITFNKAQAIQVQIDHIVSLGEAWRSGASAWTPAERLKYANDPGVLVATTQKINDAKSDHDAAQAWRECVKRGPTGKRCTGWQDDRPTGDNACDYAIHVVTIKTEYHLTADPSERDSLRSYLEGCAS
jgi:hypothetical protein